MHTMLPTFIVIGAAKSGTTSLHRYLGSHPQVFMSERKELDFFLEDHEARGDVRWYEAQFAKAGDAVARGESSPRYTLYPEFRSRPDRMAALLPAARLVYLVRDPVERAISHYRERWLQGRERRPPARALFESRFYLDGSRYASQIERYLRVFPRQQILVVRAEHLLHRRVETVAQVLRFIGVDDAWTAPELEIVHHRSHGRLGTSSWARIVREARWYSHVKHFIPSRLRRKVREKARRRLPPGDLEPEAEIRERLADQLAPEVARFVAITGEESLPWGIP